jgi:hypothetical protein
MPYFKYRLHWADGEDAGEAEYVERTKPGELIWLNGGQQVRVESVIETEDES